MAEDSKQTLKELEDSFSKLNSLGTEIVSDFGKSLNIQLRNSIDNSSKLIKEIEKGKDVSKDLTKEFTNLKNVSRNLYQEQLSLEAKLASAVGQNAKAKLKNQLNSVKAQQKLNEYTFEEVNTLKNVNEEKKKSNSLSDSLKQSSEKILGSQISSVKEMFTLTGLFAFLIQSAFKADAQTTELAKSLGVSKDQAYDLRQNMANFALSSGDAFITTDRLAKAQADLSQQLGIAVNFSNEERVNFAKLTELTGLTAEEAGKLTLFAASTGKSTKEYASSIRTGAFFAQQATKTHFSTKQILQDVSKLSSGILVKFQGNPKALAQAVVEAKKLGTNLETIDKIGESLLNFESSLESELKAELLTSKQINLEKARYASLTGNQLDLTREISSQVGSLAEFQNLNVIAQKSLAEAFGLSRDEMSGMLMQQEAINKYGDEAAKLNAQQLEDMEKQGLSLSQYLEQQEQQQSAQEKFNNTILKLQDIVSNLVAGPFGKLLDIIASILNSTTALSAIMGLYIGKLAYTLTLKTAELLLSRRNAQANAVDASIEAGKSAAKVPVIGAVLGIAAALASFAVFSGLLNKQSVQDGIAPPGKGPFTITDSFGATAVTAKGDGIAVSPNISRSNEINNTSIDLTPMITAINQVKSAVDRLYSKDTSINMDGKKVGTTLTQGSYKVA
jgi:hypothetical protein